MGVRTGILSVCAYYTYIRKMKSLTLVCRLRTSQWTGR